MTAQQFTLADFRSTVESLWPAATAETWDRVGLVSGRNAATLHRVLLSVDAVRATVDEAIEWGADALFTHHPLLLRGVNSVAEDTGKGSLLADLIRSNCALFTAHTNADQPTGGVSAVMADRLGLLDAVPLVPAEGPTETFGIGRFGRTTEPITLRAFAERVASVLPKTASGVRVAGDPLRPVQQIALLGGAGDSLLDNRLVRGADVYLTSDLRHHPAQDSLELSAVVGGPALIDVSHWAAESLWLEGAAESFTSLLPGVEFRVSQKNTDPWNFALGCQT